MGISLPSRKEPWLTPRGCLVACPTYYEVRRQDGVLLHVGIALEALPLTVLQVPTDLPEHRAFLLQSTRTHAAVNIASALSAPTPTSLYL